MDRTILSLGTKFTSKWIEDFIIKLYTLNLIEKKMGNSLELIDTRDFLDETILAQALRSSVNKCDLMELESFCMVKDIIIQTMWQPIECENYYQLHI